MGTASDNGTVARVDVAVDLTYDRLYVSRYSFGSWGAPALLGTLYTPYENITSGVGRSDFVARLADGKLHWFSA